MAIYGEYVCGNAFTNAEMVFCLLVYRYVCRNGFTSAAIRLDPHALCLQEPTPAPYIKEMADAGTFYVNRVLKDFKEK